METSRSFPLWASGLYLSYEKLMMVDALRFAGLQLEMQMRLGYPATVTLRKITRSGHGQRFEERKQISVEIQGHSYRTTFGPRLRAV